MKNLAKLGLATLMTITSLNINAQNKNTENENSLLWEVTGNGLSKPSYISGTYHVMCNKDFEIKPKVVNALEKAENFVMEINYTDASEMMALQKSMLSDKKLSEQLTPNEAKELDEILTNYGTNLKNMDNYSPQMLYGLLSMKAIACPQTEIKSYDIELMQLALKNNKKIDGLETVQHQLNTINSAYDLKEVMKQLKMSKEYEVLFAQMTYAFKKEDANSLYSLFKNDKFMNRKQEKVMLTDRNNNWAVKMPEIMKKQSTFFAVGAAHLLGDNGIVKLLRSKGYIVKPVSN